MKEIIILLLLVQDGLSQRLGLPLRSEVSLAGNYGELRRSHFHMGIDFKTNGKENSPVYASESGYVSRIVISPTGYGKCIYVNHPQSGLTTVYAHLNSLNPNIESWVDHIQYALRKNILDTLLPPDLFVITKGDQIALSGNTGSSNGPHLHFEVRNIFTEKTINPQFFFANIRDEFPPKIEECLIYEHSNGISSYYTKVEANDVEVESEDIGIAVSTKDQMDKNGNSLGIYKISLVVNNHLIYRLQFDSLDFNWQGHIKAVSDYSIASHDVYKLFYETCGFNPTDPKADNGILHFKENEIKNVAIIAEDFFGHTTYRRFRIRYHSNPDRVMAVKSLDCNQENEFKARNFDLTFPEQSLATNSELQYEVLPFKDPEVFNLRIWSEYKPVLRPYQLIYKPGVDLPDRSKIYLYSRADNKNKTYTGVWEGTDLRFAKIKNLGCFSIRYDKEIPRITLNSKSKESLIFTIVDDESDIANFNMYINGEWRKVFYDMKSDQLIYKIQPRDLGKQTTVTVEAEDKVGNKNTLSYEIFF